MKAPAPIPPQIVKNIVDAVAPSSWMTVMRSKLPSVAIHTIVITNIGIHAISNQMVKNEMNCFMIYKFS